MHILISRFRSGAEFLERFLEDTRHGGLFHPTRKALEPGEPVLLDIRMPDLKDSMLIRGKVAFRQRGKRGTPQRAGLGIEFLKSEHARRDHLLALAKGEDTSAAQRRHKRLPVDLRVDWRVPSQVERHRGRLDDIGTGGLFIRTRNLPQQGTPLVVELTPPGRSQAHSIEGRVAWTSSSPGSEGVGVEFRCRDIAGSRRLRELVRRIEEGQAAEAGK